MHGVVRDRTGAARHVGVGAVLRRLARAGVASTWALRRLLEPAPYAHAFRDVVMLGRRNWLLTLEMTKRDMRGEHSGQVLGAAWGIGRPLTTMLLYALIFGVVFRVKIPQSYELPRDFTTYLLAGMVPWLAFIQAMAKSASSIADSGSLVKQSSVDLELIPLTRSLGAALPLTVGIAFVTVYLLASDGTLPLTYLLVPLLLALQLVAMAGAGLMLSAIGAFVRDVKELVQIFALMGIFLLPIVYLPSAVPDIFRPFLYANPFSYIVWCYQDAIYFGRFEHPWAWVVFSLGTLLLFLAGYRLFRKLKPYFGNVL